MLRLFTLIIFFFIILLSGVMGQMTLTLGDLKNKNNLYVYEKNPALLMDVKLDGELIDGKDSLSVMYSYFIDCVLALQKNDFLLEERIANKLFNADYTDVCQMGSISEKAECALSGKLKPYFAIKSFA